MASLAILPKHQIYRNPKTKGTQNQHPCMPADNRQQPVIYYLSLLRGKLTLFPRPISHRSQPVYSASLSHVRTIFPLTQTQQQQQLQHENAYTMPFQSDPENNKIEKTQWLGNFKKKIVWMRQIRNRIFGWLVGWLVDWLVDWLVWQDCKIFQHSNLDIFVTKQTIVLNDPFHSAAHLTDNSPTRAFWLDHIVSLRIILCSWP